MERINTLTHRFFGNYVYCDLLAWGAPRWIAKLCALLFSLILLEMVMVQNSVIHIYIYIWYRD